MQGISEIRQEKVVPHAPENKVSFVRAAKPAVSKSHCQQNYNCITFCPRNAIFLDSKGFPEINYSLCDGCLICLRECPASAIGEGHG